MATHEQAIRPEPLGVILYRGKRLKIRIRHTPNCRNPYTATAKGVGSFGFGLTPKEARESLLKQLEADQFLKEYTRASSSVTQIKEVYRRSSKGQRAVLRAWFQRVLSGEDGNE